MSKTTDFLLEVMDRHQFDEMSELQDYFYVSVVQNGTVTINTLVKEEKNESKNLEVLPS